MKVIVVAKAPTHHTMMALRSLGLKHYKVHGSGVHESWEAFNTIREAKEHLKNREIDSDAVNLPIFLTGYERLDFIEGKESYSVKWD